MKAERGRIVVNVRRFRERESSIIEEHAKEKVLHSHCIALHSIAFSARLASYSTACLPQSPKPKEERKRGKNAPVRCACDCAFRRPRVIRCWEVRVQNRGGIARCRFERRWGKSKSQEACEPNAGWSRGIRGIRFEGKEREGV